jgi:tetratricopeptide (TPR) repeat protein
LFAVLACGLQLTFWEHATAATGEMLDLFLFAWLVRCLLEFRVERKEGWLMQFAVIYGAAVTNNYAMMAFFPVFLAALVWIKGWEFFQLRFVVRMVLLGLAGLAFYLVLPLVGTFSGVSDLGFGAYLRNVLGLQKQSLASFPPYVVLLLALQVMVPVLVMGVRTKTNPGDTNAAGAAATRLVVGLIHVLMLALCLTAFLDLQWGPRRLGFGMALLPFYFLAALGLAYYSGYLLLVVRQPASRVWRRPTAASSFALQAVTTLVVLMAAGTTLFLIYKNVRVLRENDGRALSQMAEAMVLNLPEEGAYLIADTPTELMLAEAALHRRKADHSHVLLRSSLLPYHAYHAQLAKRHPDRWLPLADAQTLPEPLPASFLANLVTSLAATNRVFYLHPSLGYYFETLYAEPHGLVFALKQRPPDPTAPLPLGEEVRQQNQTFWEGVQPALQRLAAVKDETNNERYYLRTYYARALNHWGVALQRAGELQRAAAQFELALKLNPYSDQARVNLDFNKELAAAAAGGQPLADRDFNQLPPLKSGYQTWDELILMNGPFDSPAFTAQVGWVFAQGGNYRQGFTELSRVQTWFPTNSVIALLAGYARGMARFTAGDVEGAERDLRKLQAAFPNKSLPSFGLSQILLARGEFEQAVPELERQLALDPNDRGALLNLAVVKFQQKKFDEVVGLMNRLLEVAPDYPPALMNRATAHLQLGNLDGAERDYLALVRALPRSHAVQYGLAEIAARRNDTATAIRHWQSYLETAPKNTDEYRAVEQRLREARGGRAG